MSKVAHAPSAAAPALGWGAGGFCGVLKDAQEGCWGTGWGAGWAAGVGCWKAAKPTPGDGALGAGDDMLRSTNVFEKNDEGHWRLILHQSVPIAAPIEGFDEDPVEYDADDFPGATG